MKRKPKPRERGEGGLFRIEGSKNWYIKTAGKRVSTGTPVKAVAVRKLQERMGTLSLGIPAPENLRKLQYEHVKDSLLAEYRHRGRELRKRTSSVKHLDGFFSGRAVFQITTDLLRDFVRKRKTEGASAGTINRSLEILRAMLHQARKEGKLQTVPHFPMLQEAPPRSGFVGARDFKKLLAALPPCLRPFVLFLYTTGCRTGEAQKIMWNQVHLDERVIRLEGTQTKNAEPRALPLVNELVSMLSKIKVKSGFVFPVGDFRKAWSTACVKAGLGTRTKGPENGNYGVYTGLIPHDLRRSAVRNLIRLGVSQPVAMSISGHKTIAVFQRYDITDERDKHAAMKKIGSSLGQVLPGTRSGRAVSARKQTERP
jgi:integrase